MIANLFQQTGIKQRPIQMDDKVIQQQTNNTNNHNEFHFLD